LLPFREHRGIKQPMAGFLPRIRSRHSNSMNTATPFPWLALSPERNTGRTSFGEVFEHAPIAVARCNADGVILEMNPAFEQISGTEMGGGRRVCVSEMASARERDKVESFMRELFDAGRQYVEFDTVGRDGEAATKWIAWRLRGTNGASTHALLTATRINGESAAGIRHEESQLQAQRWQAIGRLAGGVVHDFNNLLTGVMLYCDLMLCNLDEGEHCRRYAEQIRSAIVQAAGLVDQLLVFARPQAASERPLSLNEIAGTMRVLLGRLIGENIELDLRLDPDLGLVSIDQAQAEQVLLNLVLNARDALPNGGRITIETSNCQFQPVGARPTREGTAPFPCILLVVADNGHGMTREVRERLCEPFFTTKNAGQGTGLGLTTVRSIVTSNRGLIHFESEPGQGTRVLVLLPRACGSSSSPINAAVGDAPNSVSPPTPFQEAKKE